MPTIELNNIRRDRFNGEVKSKSPVVEIFRALVNGEDLTKYGAKADVAVDHIKELGNRAANGDYQAVSELNAIRRFVLEVPVMQEIKMLSVFGSYQAYDFDETIEREVYHEVGEMSRIQAPNGDVVFPSLQAEIYPVPTFTVSGGYATDYRRVQLGDMTHENVGMANVRTSIMNQAKAEIVRRIYNAITAASVKIKHVVSTNPLTKTAVDQVIKDVRRWGKTSVVGDYSVVSQFNAFAGYQATINSKDILGISENQMDEIAKNGMVSWYNGTALVEMENPYNVFAKNAAGTNYATLLPEGLAFVLPTGVQSPIATYTRGGLTSLTGDDVKSGHRVTRFDLEVGCDIAHGQEDRIGLIYDTQLGGL